MKEFFQSSPELKNQYNGDWLLKSYLKRVIPENYLNIIEPDLERFGRSVLGEIREMGIVAEANPPKHVPYDPWGIRIDQIQVSTGWKYMEKISAQEGLVAIGYERKFAEFSRIYQFAKLYLFHPFSAVYTCPLAMTDGAARLLEVYGSDEQKNKALNKLTSRNPDEFWTSGQWMTEKEGGSDVGQTGTIARMEEGNYKLYGTKWFTSATTSQMAITLARIENKAGESVSGSRGLSLFYLELRDTEGKLDNIQIHRLKDKLGTKALPTAELTLSGTSAQLIGNPGEGVKRISTLFNITRIYNSISALAYMKHALELAVDYSRKRTTFGKKLSEHPLHQKTLADLTVEFHAAFHMVFYTLQLLGKVETSKDNSEDNLVLRILTPLIKLYTAKQTISLISEVIESFGGAGYVEDTGLPRLLRDSQVLPIWEGTTNILSLDTLRAIFRENALEPFMKNLNNRLEKFATSNWKDEVDKIKSAGQKITNYIKNAPDNDFMETGSRNLSYSLFQIFSASLLIEHAIWSEKTADSEVTRIIAMRWIEKGLVSLSLPVDQVREENRIIAFGYE